MGLHIHELECPGRVPGGPGGGPGGSWGGPWGSRAILGLLGPVLVEVCAVPRPSGTGLGVVLGVLGASWAGLGPSWALLGGPRGGLGGFWGRLGGLLEASWGVLEGLGIVLGRSWATNAGKRKIDDGCMFLKDSVRCAHGSSGLSSAQQQPADLVLLLRSLISGVIHSDKQ